MGLKKTILAAIIASMGASSTPANVLTLQRFRTTSLASPVRVRLAEGGRNYLIVRNTEASNVAQIAFTAVSNSSRNAPTAGFIDINPNEEWYEVGSTNQVWLRSKVDTQSITVEVECSVVRVQ